MKTRTVTVSFEVATDAPVSEIKAVIKAAVHQSLCFDSIIEAKAEQITINVIKPTKN